MEKLKATRAKPAFAAARSDVPVVADGRLSEPVWMKTRYSDFGGVTVGAAYDGKALSFYTTGKGVGHVFCLYPPSIDNKRYRFEVGADGRVSCEVSPGGKEPGAFGATATVKKSPRGEVCEITIPVERIHPLRSGDMWQVIFGKPEDGADWRAGTGYSSLAIGAPYRMNGNFADLGKDGLPKGWVFADGPASVERTKSGNVVLLSGRMFRTMSDGDLRQNVKGRRLRFSFRAKGDGTIRVAFYRYTDVADKDNPDRFKKHTYKRISHTPHGKGGTFRLTPEMSTYSGEYTVAAGEWCAIAFYREGSSEPATIADVSVTLVEDESN